jgi:DNA-binding LacI/PurR family transcriptional regulator
VQTFERPGAHLALRSGAAVKRATIKDVARLAGVDVSTVSRAMRGNPRISELTRARVAQAARDLDYRPNAAARAMVTSRTRAFAFLVPSLGDPNVASFAAGAEARARAHGYSMVVVGYRSASGPPDRGTHLFREHRFDGVLLMSPRHYPEPALDLPLATLEEARVDNHGGAALTGALLARHGHREVAFVGGEHDSPHARERFLGLRSVLGDGVRCRYGDWTPQSGFDLTTRLLDHDPSITAIVAANDAVALGVYGALHERGRTIPGDVSVVGFDDTPTARHYWPRLTTVAQPLELVGATAFELLLARIDGHEPEPPPLLGVRLEERASVGPAPPSD